jgi:hypothetical protein
LIEDLPLCAGIGVIARRRRNPPCGSKDNLDKVIERSESGAITPGASLVMGEGEEDFWSSKKP